MVIYFDTSALIKRYIREAGTEKVRDLFRDAQSIVVSSITKLELFSTLKRSLIEKRIKEPDYEKTRERIQDDFMDFQVVKFDEQVENSAIEIIEKYQVKAMDSIQIASFFLVKNDETLFVSCDTKMFNVMKAEKIKVINPLHV